MFEQLVMGVSRHHGAFVAKIEGQKLLQVGGASRGAFTEWFRRRGREVEVDGEGEYDAAYSQGLLDGMREKDVQKLVRKVLGQAPVFVSSVPSPKWRYTNVRRTAADYERILSRFKVEAFAYWGGRMLCVVARKKKKRIAKTEIVKTEPIKAEVAKTEPVKTEERVDFSEWKRE